jgi:mannose-1-phosphate guanylyltransferase
MINIILCGGSGTRLWPVSRKLFPKQFCKFVDKTSLFQDTVIRNSELCSKNFIVTSEDQYFLAFDQLKEIDYNNYSFLLEPVGRNTAPAIAISCMLVEEDDIVFVTPSDHVINNLDNYKNVVELAKSEAKKGKIVTFGIKPTHAHTGYGYIEIELRRTGVRDMGLGVEKNKLSPESRVPNPDSFSSVFSVKSFKEKPDKETAEEYLKKGNFLWNSGMFVFKAGVFLSELKKYSPEIYEKSKIAVDNMKRNKDLCSENNKCFYRINIDDMRNIPANSIDYAVIEKSSCVKVIPCDIGWDDLGSFDALFKYFPKDENGNTKDENFINMNSRNNMVISTQKRTIATIDTEDLVIIDTPDALLVTRKGSTEKIKDIVDILKEKNSDLSNIHLTVHRPWGTYTILEQNHRYKINITETLS